MPARKITIFTTLKRGRHNNGLYNRSGTFVGMVAGMYGNGFIHGSISKKQVIIAISTPRFYHHRYSVMAVPKYWLK
jgi:hypothetical protein